MENIVIRDAGVIDDVVSFDRNKILRFIFSESTNIYKFGFIYSYLNRNMKRLIGTYLHVISKNMLFV